jgi:hypothetical protein
MPKAAMRIAAALARSRCQETPVAVSTLLSLSRQCDAFFPPPQGNVNRASGSLHPMYQANMTVIALGSVGILVLFLFRQWIWFILLPPGIAMLVYAVLNTIWHHHY